jgi:hypothetical protein
MTVHLAIFRGTTAGDPNLLLTPIQDSILPRLTEVYQLSRDLLCIGAVAAPSALALGSLARLMLPSRPDLGNPVIAPLTSPVISGTPDLPAEPGVLDLSMHPIALAIGDTVAIEVNDVSAVTYVAGVFLADALRCPGPGPIRWVTYSCAALSSPADDRWQAAELVLDERLPAGRYHVLGIRHQQVDVDAARLVFPNQVLRPGTFTIDNRNTGRVPGLPGPETSGILGTFDAMAPPSLELFFPAGTCGAGLGMLLLQRADDGPTRGCGCGAGAGPCACGGACGRR